MRHPHELLLKCHVSYLRLNGFELITVDIVLSGVVSIPQVGLGQAKTNFR